MQTLVTVYYIPVDRVRQKQNEVGQSQSVNMVCEGHQHQHHSYVYYQKNKVIRYKVWRKQPLYQHLRLPCVRVN